MVIGMEWAQFFTNSKWYLLNKFYHRGNIRNDLYAKDKFESNWFFYEP